jgi:uncharacterized membrane protein
MTQNDILPKKLHFPLPFKHHHEPVQNVNQLYEQHLTASQRISDLVANTMGSWKFIIVQSIILTIWVVLNAVAWVQHWDPYPFILMNLVLSMQAAYAAPIIMMSQNRQAAKDRLEAHNDFMINQKTEEEIRVVLEHLEGAGSGHCRNSSHVTVLAAKQRVTGG